MKIIYICVGESLTGKTILANLLKKQIEVIDNYLPNFLTNIQIAEHINYVKDKDAVFFIVCSEYPSELIVTLEQYLLCKCKVIICENSLAISKEDFEEVDFDMPGIGAVGLLDD